MMYEAINIAAKEVADILIKNEATVYEVDEVFKRTKMFLKVMEQKTEPIYPFSNKIPDFSRKSNGIGDK